MQSYGTHYKIPHTDLEYGKKLGEGGFGEVFEGTWQHSQVAIKRLKMQKLSPEAYQELETEAKMMSELRHDNIVGFRGFCNESPNYALVMEYLPRGSLYTILHESGQEIDWASKVRISIGAGAGLVYLHNRNILHRDIKSLNVLLHEKEGTLHAKLSDFGLSVLKIETMASSKARKGFAGTLQYGAPELHDDESHQKASDVYSYAVMLWEIAARQLPFANAKSSAALMRQAIMGHQEAVPEETPTQFKEAIELGRNVTPSTRPTAEEIVGSLKLLMESLPKLDATPSPQPKRQMKLQPQLLSGLQGNYPSVTGKQFPAKIPAKKMLPGPKSFQGNVGTDSVKMMPKKIVPKQLQAANSVIGNLASNSVEPTPSDKITPVAKNPPGKLVIKNPPKIIIPLSAQPKGGVPASSLSGVVENLQSKNVARPSALDNPPPFPLPSPPTQTPSAAEEKLAQQKAENASLKNSMDALLEMKKREDKQRDDRERERERERMEWERERELEKIRKKEKKAKKKAKKAKKEEERKLQEEAEADRRLRDKWNPTSSSSESQEKSEELYGFADSESDADETYEKAKELEENGEYREYCIYLEKAANKGHAIAFTKQKPG